MLCVDGITSMLEERTAQVILTAPCFQKRQAAEDSPERRAKMHKRRGNEKEGKGTQSDQSSNQIQWKPTTLI